MIRLRSKLGLQTLYAPVSPGFLQLKLQSVARMDSLPSGTLPALRRRKGQCPAIASFLFHCFTFTSTNLTSLQFPAATPPYQISSLPHPWTATFDLQIFAPRPPTSYFQIALALPPPLSLSPIHSAPSFPQKNMIVSASFLSASFISPSLSLAPTTSPPASPLATSTPVCLWAVRMEGLYPRIRLEESSIEESSHISRQSSATSG